MGLATGPGVARFGLIAVDILLKMLKKSPREFLAIKEAADALERKRRLDALKNAPDLKDWRKVYNWELTKQGKTLMLQMKSYNYSTRRFIDTTTGLNINDKERSEVKFFKEVA